MRETKIRAFVMDVDGTLTDGGIYIGNAGEIMKRFYVRDGYAIKHILPEYGILAAVITGRQSSITEARCRELNIRHVVQGSQDKLADLAGILAAEGISLAETAFIGDDLNDLECMDAAGLSGCPSDAAREVVKKAGYVAESPGGHGAVREFIEWIVSSRQKSS